MTDIADLASNARGLGTGGAKVKTAIAVPGGLRETLLDIAADLDEGNTEGVFGVTLRVTATSLGEGPGGDPESPLGWGAAGILPAGAVTHLRQILRYFALDLADLDTAGVAFGPTHTTAKIGADFLSGGRHMHRNPAFGQKRPLEDDGNLSGTGTGPDGLYDWIVQPLNAIAVDIAAFKAANTLTFTPRTTPV